MYSHYMYTGTRRDCNGDRYNPVANPNIQVLEVCGQEAPQPGEIPRSENCLANKLQPPAGYDVIVLPNHGSLFIANSGRRGTQPWTSQATE